MAAVSVIGEGDGGHSTAPEARAWSSVGVASDEQMDCSVCSL
jgi:hypothetical protein